MCKFAYLLANLLACLLIYLLLTCLLAYLLTGAEPSMCKLVMPKDEVLYSGKTHSIILETYDKHGNPCNSGGLSTNVRLQLVKTNMHDQTMLMPNNHTVLMSDNGDGTYNVDITLIKIAATIKVIVNMDKNIPSAGGELPAVTMIIVGKSDAPAPTGHAAGREAAEAAPPAPDGVANAAASASGSGEASGGSVGGTKGLRGLAKLKKGIAMVAEGISNSKQEEKARKGTSLAAVAADLLQPRDLSTPPQSAAPSPQK